MSRTITAMYDSRSDAEAAREQLRSAVGAEARIIDQSSSGMSTGSSGSSTLGGSDDRYNRTASSYDASAGSSGSSGRGFWGDLKDAFMSDEDRHSYEEGVRRGGYLLCATVSESQADQAITILDQTGSVDFEQREQEWRGQGWAGYQGGQAMGAASLGSTSARGGTVDEERIPIVEEQLRVGKREVSRGGARVRSYVEEVPVQETVSLREEHVNIERRPVDQSLSAADLDKNALFQDRTIEVTETAEEAVVGKEARITEEVVVSKTATERTEEINDTVRRTEVDVDRTGTDRDGFTDRNR